MRCSTTRVPGFGAWLLSLCYLIKQPTGTTRPPPQTICIQRAGPTATREEEESLPPFLSPMGHSIAALQSSLSPHSPPCIITACSLVNIRKLLERKEQIDDLPHSSSTESPTVAVAGCMWHVGLRMRRERARRRQTGGGPKVKTPVFERALARSLGESILLRPCLRPTLMASRERARKRGGGE